MNSREKLDVSAYLIIGPENTLGRDVIEVIREALEGGFTMVQIRSKVATARELIKLTVDASNLISEMGLSDKVTLVVNDRLDIVLAARMAGAKVDGIHVGQEDIPVSVCRKYLGPDSVIGLSARTEELFDYIRNVDVSEIDYFGASPLFETATKPDAGLVEEGVIVTRSYEEIRKLAELSPLPVTFGGGVKEEHLFDLARTGISGFFVVTAVTHADNPKEAAKKLVVKWQEGVKKTQ